MTMKMKTRRGNQMKVSGHFFFAFHVHVTTSQTGGVCIVMVFMYFLIS